MSSISGGGISGAGVVLKKGLVVDNTTTSRLAFYNQYSVAADGTWQDIVTLDGVFGVTHLEYTNSTPAQMRIVHKDTGEVLLFAPNSQAESSQILFGAGVYYNTASGVVGSDSGVYLYSDCVIQIKSNAGFNNLTLIAREL